MRGDDDRLELEQRRLRARLLRPHVDTGAGDPAFLECVRQGLLVHDAATGRVDYAHGRLDELEGLFANQTQGLRRLGQVHRDEVALAQQLIEGDEPNAELARARHAHIGVVRNDLHAKAGKPLRGERADAAEADDAHGLVEQLDAAILAALPVSYTHLTLPT